MTIAKPGVQEETVNQEESTNHDGVFAFFIGSPIHLISTSRRVLGLSYSRLCEGSGELPYLSALLGYYHSQKKV
jgi:hypothetical protein